jgi:hypothetical protein
MNWYKRVLFKDKLKNIIMKTNSFAVSAVAILFTVTACSGDKKSNSAEQLWSEIALTAADNMLTDREQNNGWQLLFDGKTFKGWHGYNMKEIPGVWSVTDGCFMVDGKSGGEEQQDIITDKTYRKFAFTVEYKLSQGSNSGIVYQVKEAPKYAYSYETGPEFQLIDQDNWYDPLEDWQIHGANYAMYPPEAKPYRPTGEWNRLLLVVDGNKVTQIINGVKTVFYEKYSDDWNAKRNSGKWVNYPDWGKFDEGPVCLQNHGTKLWFKNIKIKELK